MTTLTLDDFTRDEALQPQPKWVMEGDQWVLRDHVRTRPREGDDGRDGQPGATGGRGADGQDGRDALGFERHIDAVAADDAAGQSR